MIRKTINKKLYLAILPLTLIFFISCTNNSYVKKDSAFTPEGWKKIVVFPFTGSRGFTYLATEAFTFHIKAKEHFEIVPPRTAYASIKETRISAEDNVISLENAINIAEQLDAQVLIMGNIETMKADNIIDAIANIKVIDVKTGGVVAESYRPSGLKVKNSEEQCVIISVGNASVDINAFLVEAAKKNISVKEIKPAGSDQKTARDLKQKK